ncbi:MAG: hypothetical protein V4637_04205, partial [Pseudomonadota bacterium]
MGQYWVRRARIYPQAAPDMSAALVHCAAGACGSHQTFMTRAETYTAMLKEHMRKEESLLAKAADALSESQ